MNYKGNFIHHKENLDNIDKELWQFSHAFLEVIFFLPETPIDIDKNRSKSLEPTSSL